VSVARSSCRGPGLSARGLYSFVCNASIYCLLAGYRFLTSAVTRRVKLVSYQVRNGYAPGILEE
jgi:MFS superfamily sulfate permease-like transporter